MHDAMETEVLKQRGGTMKVESQGETLNISGIKELGAANSQVFRE